MSPLVLGQEVLVPELLVAAAALEQLRDRPLLELCLLTIDRRTTGKLLLINSSLMDLQQS